MYTTAMSYHHDVLYLVHVSSKSVGMASQLSIFSTTEPLNKLQKGCPLGMASKPSIP